MSKLITLGCSLTHQYGWADRVSETLNLPLVNTSMSSGSNQLQIYKMQKMILNDEVSSDDIVIWQVTGVERRHVRVKDILQNRKPAEDESVKYKTTSFISSSENMFDNLRRLDHLSHSMYAASVVDRSKLGADIGQRLEDLLFMLKTTKKFTNNLLVIFGWNTVMPDVYLEKFKNYLDINNIAYIKDTIVDWCREQDLPFNGEDKTHPEGNSYRKYADDVILPKLRDII